MEYDKNFVECFIKRTLELLESYNEEYDATLILNCLLGLLIVPKERFYNIIPCEPISNWGLVAEASSSMNLKCFVRAMRNAVSHFTVEPIHCDEKVSGFAFNDRNGGCIVKLSLSQLRAFSIKLANFLFESSIK